MGNESLASADLQPGNISTTEVVTDELDHGGEPPAIIDAHEASLITDELWASQVLSSAIPSDGQTTQADLVPSISDVIVLALTKHSKAVEDLLLNTELAQSLISQGVDVKPSWACGAKVFVENFSHGDLAEFRLCFGQREGPGVNHIVIYSKDEQIILQALRPDRGQRKLASVKRGGRLEVSANTRDDWFRCSEAASSKDKVALSEESSDEEDVPMERPLPLYRIITKNTFIEGFELVQDLHQTSHMAPLREF